MDSLCKIDILKNGRDFMVRIYLEDGGIKEYRRPVFEEVLTEMVIDLQEFLEE
jgi:hypothetical protein